MKAITAILFLVFTTVLGAKLTKEKLTEKTNYRMNEPIVISRELKFHYSDPSRQPQRGSVQVTNMLDLPQSTSIFKNVMLTWGKTWSSPSQTLICQPTLIR